MKKILITVEIVRHFAKANGKWIWITRLLNPVIWLFGNHVRALGKTFSDSTYDMEMSQYPFDYQIVSFKESLKRLVTRKDMC